MSANYSDSDYSEEAIIEGSDYSDSDNETVLDTKPMKAGEIPIESSSDDDDGDDTLPDVESQPEDDDDTVEISNDTTNKQKSSENKATKNKQKKEKRKTTYNYISIENIAKDIKTPSISEFIKSSAYEAITWMLKNIHKKNDSAKNGKKEHAVFNETLNKKQLNDLYNLFAKVYSYKKAFRDLLNDTSKEPRFQLKKVIELDGGKQECMAITYKKNTTTNKCDIYYCPQDIVKDIKAYNEMINDLYFNVNKNGITIDNVYDFIKLDIWTTDSIYELKDSIKLDLLDFPQFGINYTDDIEYKYNNDSKCIEDYISLFNQKTIKEPVEVFKRRAGIISGNEHMFTEAKIKEIFNKCIVRIDNKCDTDVDKILAHMLANESYRNIFIKLYKPNKFIDRCLTVLFKAKDFKNIVSSKLYELSFLFGPYMFRNQNMEDDFGLGNKSKIATKLTSKSRKETIIKDFILNNQDNCDKDKNYWLSFFDTPRIDNYWFNLKDDEKLEEGKVNDLYVKSTQPKQQKQKESSASRHSNKKKSNK